MERIIIEEQKENNKAIKSPNWQTIKFVPLGNFFVAADKNYILSLQNQTDSVTKADHVFTYFFQLHNFFVVHPA